MIGQYLHQQPELDSKFEILQYFLQQGGTESQTTAQIIDYLNTRTELATARA